jgi:hypothetical protein
MAKLSSRRWTVCSRRVAGSKKMGQPSTTRSVHSHSSFDWSHLTALCQFPFTNLPELIDESRSLNIRFTRTQSSLFIISLIKPSAPTFIVPAKLPILKGDTVHLLGCGSGKGKHKKHKEEEELDWVWSEKNGGELRISVGRPEKRIDRGSLAWVFEIRHRR